MSGPDKKGADDQVEESEPTVSSDAPTAAMAKVEQPKVEQPKVEQPKEAAAQPDSETERIDTRSVPYPTPPRRIPPKATPQRVGPSPAATPVRQRGRTWWWVAAVVALVVIVGGIVAALLVNSSEPAPEETADSKIRTTVTAFTEALVTGDLAALRSTTCGDLATFYRDIPDLEFASVHEGAVAQGNIPIVRSIDAVQVTDLTAIVQVTAYTQAQPDVQSARTFDLAQEGEVWKVCA